MFLSHKVVRQAHFILDVPRILDPATFAKVIEEPDRVNSLGLLPVFCSVFEGLGYSPMFFGCHFPCLCGILKPLLLSKGAMAQHAPAFYIPDK